MKERLDFCIIRICRPIWQHPIEIESFRVMPFRVMIPG
jgi:hypothetical protein